jgi:site-specific DNA recombinase
MRRSQTKNCAIYTRVSTDIQAEKEFSSCESQEEKIRSFIKSQNNWQVFKVYSDAGYTGGNTNRPALQELLEDTKQRKIDVVLSYKIDRLTRSPKDFYQLIEVFEKYQADFISITERFDTSTPAGRLLRNIMLTFAQFERELTSERTKDKLLERAKKGMWNGGTPLFGYERKNKKLIINKKEAEIITMIFETYLETGSIVELFNFLKDKNIKNRQGKDFSKPHLAFILRNITYTGKINYAGQIYQGIHQPIVSQELFDLAQKTHKKRIKKFRVYKYFLLGGLIRCKECGYKMSACFTNKHKKGKLKRYYYYRCVSVDKKGWQACSTKQVSAVRLEKYILENLERISLDKSYIENLVFKLNHSLKGSSPSLKNSGSPVGNGHEPSEACSKFSSEAVGSLLRSFLKFLSQRRGVERNLLVKRFIKEIVYSKENIEINLFYRLNPQISDIQNKTALLLQGSSNFSGKNEATSFPPQEKQFVDECCGVPRESRTLNLILRRDALCPIKLWGLSTCLTRGPDLIGTLHVATKCSVQLNYRCLMCQPRGYLI